MATSSNRSTVKRSLTRVPLSSKKAALKLVAAGKRKKDVAHQFGVPANTLSTWIKNRDKILSFNGWLSMLII